MSDKELIEVVKLCCEYNPQCAKCPLEDRDTSDECMGELLKGCLELINRQQAEIERLKDLIKSVNEDIGKAIIAFDKDIAIAKTEAIKEFAEKIDQLFYRYAPLRSHADMARKDYIKADDGTEIEMQSVWDVFTLKKYGIAEYEEMNRLQTNIELIEKGRLLAELKKDFRLLVKEMTESPTKIEHSPLCETDTYEVKE